MQQLKKLKLKMCAKSPESLVVYISVFRIISVEGTKAVINSIITPNIVYISVFRIISVEGTKAVINSTITPNMTFTKTSQKFGQWSDVRCFF